LLAFLESAPSFVSETAASTIIPVCIFAGPAVNFAACIGHPDASRFSIRPLLACIANGLFTVNFYAIVNLVIPSVSDTIYCAALLNHFNWPGFGRIGRSGNDRGLWLFFFFLFLRHDLWLRLGSDGFDDGFDNRRATTSNAVAIILAPCPARSALVPLGAPVIGYAVVGIFVVIVFIAAAFVGFFLQELGGNRLVKEVNALAAVTGVEGLAFRAALVAVALTVAAALVPVPLLVHSALAEQATAAGPLLCWLICFQALDALGIGSSFQESKVSVFDTLAEGLRVQSCARICARSLALGSLQAGTVVFVPGETIRASALRFRAFPRTGSFLRLDVLTYQHEGAN